MTLRVAHRFAHKPTSARCARCLLVVVLPAGSWHAVDFETGEPTCDHCARDDAAGFATLLAWRRMAAGPRRSAA